MEDLFMNSSGNGNGKKPIGKNIRADATKQSVDYDAVELTVERGIPIPPRGKSTVENKNPMLSVLLGMHVGESIQIPDTLAKHARNAMSTIQQRNKKCLNTLGRVKFVTRLTPTRTGYKRIADMRRHIPFRIWRV